ncbi:MAG TPA: hypothetical protein EYP36_06385 [Calditrichaeota bacterium]|nr:hypothetical protein [Calditrichota bacterium]
MSYILEIPVVHFLDDLEKDFIRAIPVYSDRSYRGFRHIVYKVNDEDFVYFYLLEKQEDHFVQSVWERIIPKAPFTVFLIEEINNATQELIERYKQKYSTPYFIFRPFPGGAKGVMKSNDGEDMFSFNPQDENGITKTLLDALKRYSQISVAETT